MSLEELSARLDGRVRAWDVVVGNTLETPSSILAFGTRQNQPVLLKVARQRGDEWFSGNALRAFDGNKVVRVYDHIDGSVLLERLLPGTSLATLSLAGRDDEATDVIADVIGGMAPRHGSLDAFDTVEKWGNAFDRYLESGDHQIPQTIVERASTMYERLCTTQRCRTLLHGDLQHYNILLDNSRGWTAIDPKGVVGEYEYEIAVSLRNPFEMPELFASPQAVRHRLTRFERTLSLDYDRVLQWSFAQAVLSAIWTVGDGSTVTTSDPAILLAAATAALLGFETPS